MTTPCRIVPGRRIMPKGYAYASWISPSGRHYQGAHRVALAQSLWRTEHRDIRPGYHAAHRCGVPACETVGPGHIYEASPQENNGRDRREQGRICHGVRNGRAKLTAAAVIAIRAAYRPAAHRGGHTNSRALARQHGITPQHVTLIVRGRAWKEEIGGR